MSGMDMRKMTDILESVRVNIEKGEDFEKTEKNIRAHLAKNIKDNNFNDVIKDLHEKIKSLEYSKIKAKINEYSEKDLTQGWNSWLTAFSYQLSKLNDHYFIYLLNLKFKVPSTKRDVYKTIRKRTKYVIESLWGESILLFELLIGLEEIPDATKVDLHIIAGQIQHYHLYDSEEALAHFEKAKVIEGETAKTERLFGEFYINESKFDMAEAHLQNALELDDTAYENYRSLGDLYKKRNKYKTAANWYKDGLMRDSGQPTLYNSLLQLNEDSDYYEAHHTEIDPLLDKIELLDETSVYMAINNAAYVYQKNKDLKKAKIYYQKAIDREPGRLLGHLYLGYTYLEEDEMEKAEHTFLKAVSLDKEAFDGYWALSTLNRKKKNWEEVIKYLDICSKKRVQWHQYIYSDLAFAHNKLGNIDIAKKFYLQAVEKDHSSKLSTTPIYDFANQLDLKTAVAFLKQLSKVDRSSITNTVHYRLGILYYKNKDYDNAIKEFVKAAKATPDDPFVSEYLGLCYEKTDKAALAEDMYRRSIEQAPDNPKFYNLLGYFLTEIQRFDEAIEYLNKGITIRPDPIYYENLGYAHEKNGNEKEALKAYTKALELGNENKQIYENRLGVFYKNQGDYTKALKHYSNAIKIKPLPVYYQNKALTLETIGKFEEAIQCYEQAIKLESGDSTYYYRLAFLLIKSKKYSEAVNYLKNAIDIKQEPLYLESLGYAYEYQGLGEEALKQYTKALDISTSDKDIYENRIGVFYNNQGRYNEAIAHYSNAIKIKPTANYYDNIGFAYEKISDIENAMEAYKQAVEIADENKDIYLNHLGIALYNQGRFEEAITYYQSAVRTNPMAVYYENIGKAAKFNEDFELFEEAYLKAAELEPQHGKYFYELGWNFVIKSIKIDKAKEYLKKAITLYQKTPEIEKEELTSMTYLGAAYQLEGNFDEAEKQFKDVHEIDPDNYLVCTVLGKLYLEKNDLEQSLKYYKRALEMDSDKIVNYDNVGYVFEKMNNYSEAIKIYSSAAEKNPTYYEKAAKLFFTNGDYENAEKYIRLAIEAFPKNNVYLENLALTLQFKGSYKEAEEVFIKAMNLAPSQDLDIYHNYLGNLYFAQSQFKTAANHYQKASELNPEHLVYRDNLKLSLSNLDSNSNLLSQ